jgi:signal transduction histidine kinase
MSMSIKRMIAIRVSLTALAILSLAPQAFAAPKRVLLVYQDDGYSPATLELQQGILTHLRAELGQETQFFCEQLEATRIPESQDQALAWVRTRYANLAIDVVIFIGSTPMDILSGVPTVYAGTTPFNIPEGASKRDKKTTLWFKVKFAKTISVARRLQPRAKNVLVIGGTGYEDHFLLDQIHDQLAGADISTEYLADASIQDLMVRVAQLPRDTIVLPISYTRDLNGNIYFTRHVVASLARVSTAPIYAAADTIMGSGAVGGYVVDFDKTGAVVAKIVVQILDGKPASQISVPAEDTASYIFDWRQLKRWNFPEADLPTGSIVLFRTPTAWEQYRWRIIGIIVLILTQSLLILGLLISRSNRRRAEASLHHMTGRLLESQDDERRRIARDLHDGTGQHLSGMALTIGQVLADFPPGHDQLRKLLEDSHSASRQALNEVRTVSYVLHPPILDGLGLVSALQWYLEGLKKRTDINIVFEGQADIERLSPEAERALFRIVQEGVTNVLRHSGGSGLKIRVSSTPKAVTLEIEDNGHGLDVEQLSQLEGEATLGVGIAGMRERIRQLNGIFKLQSNAEGTRVTATVPLDRNRYAAHPAGG